MLSNSIKEGIKSKVDELLKAYDLIGKLQFNNNSVNLTLLSGKYSFLEESMNHFPALYLLPEDFYGQSKTVAAELNAALYNGNHNKSRVEADYFDVGWYSFIHLGHYEDVNIPNYVDAENCCFVTNVPELREILKSLPTGEFEDRRYGDHDKRMFEVAQTLRITATNGKEFLNIAGSCYRSRHQFEALLPVIEQHIPNCRFITPREENWVK